MAQDYTVSRLSSVSPKSCVVVIGMPCPLRFLQLHNVPRFFSRVFFFFQGVFFFSMVFFFPWCFSFQDVFFSRMFFFQVFFFQEVFLFRFFFQGVS